MARMKGENWYNNIRNWICLNEEGESACDCIVLCMKSPDGYVPLANWHLSKNVVRDDALAREKTEEFLRMAQEDANSNTGLGPFNYFLMSTLDGDVISRSYFIKLHNQETDLSGNGDEYPASGKGLLAQLMKTNAELTRTVVQQYDKTVAGLVSLIETQQRRELAFQEKQTQLIADREEALSAKHDRELAAAKELRTAAMQDRVADEVFGLLPAVKARLLRSAAGGKNATVTTSVDGRELASLLASLIDGLEPEQLEKIVDVIGPNKAAVLGEIGSLAEKLSKANPEPN